MDGESTQENDELRAENPRVESQDRAASGQTIIVHAAYPLWRSVPTKRSLATADMNEKLLVRTVATWYFQPKH